MNVELHPFLGSVLKSLLACGVCISSLSPSSDCLRGAPLPGPLRNVAAMCQFGHVFDLSFFLGGGAVCKVQGCPVFREQPPCTCLCVDSRLLTSAND